VFRDIDEDIFITLPKRVLFWEIANLVNFNWQWNIFLYAYILRWHLTWV